MDTDTPDPEPTHIAADLASVMVLIGALAVSGWLLLLSFAATLCSLFGETCSPDERRESQLAFLGAVVAFFGIPALVAVVRRDARWLYAPFVEVIVGMSIATVATLF